MLKKTIFIKLLTLKNSDLLTACSDDLPGLMVQARSIHELQEKLPGIIRDLLEASGHQVESVSMGEETEHESFFTPLSLVASASISNPNDHRRILAGH